MRCGIESDAIVRRRDRESNETSWGTDLRRNGGSAALGALAQLPLLLVPAYLVPLFFIWFKLLSDKKLRAGLWGCSA
jgi:hypothetical protein